MSLFFCQFVSAVGVFKKDCRQILRSCRLSVKPRGRPHCRWDRYTGWDLLSLMGLLAWIFYFKQVRLKQHQNPYPWPPTVYQDLGIFEKV